MAHTAVFLSLRSLKLNSKKPLAVLSYSIQMVYHEFTSIMTSMVTYNKLISSLSLSFLPPLCLYLVYKVEKKEYKKSHSLDSLFFFSVAEKMIQEQSINKSIFIYIVHRKQNIIQVL